MKKTEKIGFDVWILPQEERTLLSTPFGTPRAVSKHPALYAAKDEFVFAIGKQSG